MSTDQLQNDRIDPAAGLEALQARLDLVQSQRRADLDRFRRLTATCEQLAFQLAERDAEIAGLETSKTLAKGAPPAAEPFLLQPAAVRARLRKERRTQPSLLTRVASSLTLRFARAAAARRDYASAEAFYQVILLLTPRAFVWRQLGNMLAGQGLFAAAVACFEQAIDLDDQDADAWHAQAMSLRKLDRGEEAQQALSRAIALSPAIAARNG